MKLNDALLCARDGARIRRKADTKTIIRTINGHLIRQVFATETRWGVETTPFIPTPQERFATDWVVIEEPYSEANDPAKQFTHYTNHVIINRVNFPNYAV